MAEYIGTVVGEASANAYAPGTLLGAARILRHGELRLLITVPVGDRCLLGFPVRAASTRYQFMSVRCDSLSDFELGLRSLASVVAAGSPVGSMEVDVSGTLAGTRRRASNAQVEATRWRRRWLNRLAHWLTTLLRLKAFLRGTRPSVAELTA